jgi:hypothetical protein
LERAVNRLGGVLKKNKIVKMDKIVLKDEIHDGMTFVRSTKSLSSEWKYEPRNRSRLKRRFCLLPELDDFS